MPWIAITIETDCQHAEALADSLLEQGALSASIEDADAGTPAETPQFGEPGSVTTPGWTRSRVVALLEETAAAQWETVDLASLRTGECRTLGGEAVALKTFQDLVFNCVN